MTRGAGPATRGLFRLSRLGKPGAFLGLEADLAWALGPRLAWRRLRQPPPRRVPRAELYRSIWADAADAVGATVSGLPGPYLEITRAGGRARVFEGLVELDDPVTLAVAGDKPLAHRLLAEAGLTVPEHLVGDVAAPADAVRFTLAGPPVVVKPAASTGRGDGVTGSVVSEGDVLRALLRTARFDPRRFLVERQLGGVEYRVLVLDGEVLGAVRRRPPHVTGDGRSTIADLVRAENDRRRGAPAVWPIDLDLDAVFCLRQQGLTPSTVPRDGREVRVKTGAGACSEQEAWGVDPGEPELSAIDPVARAAAEAIGSRYASVEVIAAGAASAPGTALTVLEVNTTPGLGQHYAVANPESAPRIAAAVLERLLTRR